MSPEPFVLPEKWSEDLKDENGEPMSKRSVARQCMQQVCSWPCSTAFMHDSDSTAIWQAMGQQSRPEYSQR